MLLQTVIFKLPGFAFQIVSGCYGTECYAASVLFLRSHKLVYLFVYLPVTPQSAALLPADLIKPAWPIFLFATSPAICVLYQTTSVWGLSIKIACPWVFCCMTGSMGFVPAFDWVYFLFPRIFFGVFMTVCLFTCQ